MSDTSPLQPKDLKGRHILLVEDNATFAQAMEQLLTTWQAHVLHRSNYADALRTLSAQDHAFDLVITDYDLNEAETGLDFARAAHRYYEGEVAILMMSAKIEAATMASRFTLLEKPFTPEALLMAIGEAVKKARTAN